ncbi:aminotransferase class III-fold pyridoxal phosphate-dependent enzyme [Streptomyces sp. NPDC005574]|uniref:aminotransferase class III-fold pyridoxal phosphate-dependent enzyme n=1 Tax=Streptomyces sp. NPDC005574 TaxID=3156891 RepID=UPI0033B79C40
MGVFRAESAPGGPCEAVGVTRGPAGAHPAHRGSPCPTREGVGRRQTTREPAARTYAGALPIVPVRARGLTIEGADGRRYLDCASGAGALALGHNHPVVLGAIREVLDSGAPLLVPDLTTPVRDAFTEELFRTLPPGLADRARVRFCGPAGEDAMEAAFRLVRTATGRAEILGALDLTSRRDGTGLGHPVPRLPLPAGAVLDPVHREGAVLPASDDWTRRVRGLTAARSVPLIADESMTGVGRTGAFWAVDHSGVTPDVMVLSHAIGGSLPLAVLVYREDLDVRRSDGRSDTFPGNQLAMAAGTATLAHVRRHQLARRAATLGDRLLAQLRSLPARFPCVRDVRGRGLMIGVELMDPDVARADHEVALAGAEAAPVGPEVAPGEREVAPVDAAGTRAPDHSPGSGPAASALATAVQRECLRRGLIVDVGGPHANVVRLLPPLTISDEQAAAVLDRLTDAVEEVARRPTRGGRTPPPHRRPRRHGDPAERAG